MTTAGSSNGRGDYFGRPRISMKEMDRIRSEGSALNEQTARIDWSHVRLVLPPSAFPIGEVAMFTTLARIVVLVHDQDEAARFYLDVLGFEVDHDSTTDGYRYLHLTVPGTEVGVWLMPPASAPERALVGRQAGEQPPLVLYTDDIDEVAPHLHAHDVEVWAQRDDPGSRSLHLRDVVGNTLEVIGDGPDEGTVARQRRGVRREPASRRSGRSAPSAANG
jgi:catechol 2,3-dioxygenase-like lactoylglutathione lyase family enzyme